MLAAIMKKIMINEHITHKKRLLKLFFVGIRQKIEVFL